MLLPVGEQTSGVYRASDERQHEEWVTALEAAAADLDLGDEATARATDLFLSTVPDEPQEDRSMQALLAASLYVGALVAGDRRSQGEVADAADVSRLTIQQRWKELLETAGLDAPDW